MLARLEAIAGVSRAEVDHRGELLRFRLDRPATLDAAVTVLGALGYEATPLDDPTSLAGPWYGRTTVGDLSREEARVISRRVTRAFVAQDPAKADRAGALENALAEALFRVFAARQLESTSPRDAVRALRVRAAEDATTPILGPAGARELASFLDRDLG